MSHTRAWPSMAAVTTRAPSEVMARSSAWPSCASGGANGWPLARSRTKTRSGRPRLAVGSWGAWSPSAVSRRVPSGVIAAKPVWASEGQAGPKGWPEARSQAATGCTWPATFSAPMTAKATSLAPSGLTWRWVRVPVPWSRGSTDFERERRSQTSIAPVSRPTTRRVSSGLRASAWAWPAKAKGGPMGCAVAVSITVTDWSSG